MLIIGILLGILFLVLGVVNIFVQLGFDSIIPIQLTNVIISFPELALEILFVIGGVYLWMDVARQTRVFNGLISIVVGLVAIGVGGYPLLEQLNLVSLGVIGPPVALPYLSLVLGFFLLLDNMKS